MSVKASDITDKAALSAIRECQKRRPNVPAVIWDVQYYLNKYPKKVVRAKLQSMERRGLITGCFHLGVGCRGDIEIVDVS